jgi:hypothetical protein
MSCDSEHKNHDHTHGEGCGHKTVEHDGHKDYLHDGHLHNVHDNHVHDHKISVGGANAANCTPDHKCDGHDASHKHSAGCGHDAVPHGDHTDYVVAGHLHHTCKDHCDDHGPITVH